jgi:hypothetical protein
MVSTKTQLDILHLKNVRQICVRQILNYEPNARRDLQRFKKTIEGQVFINDQNLKGKDRVCLRLLQSIWLHGSPPLEEPQNAEFISDFEFDTNLHNFIHCLICSVILRLCIVGPQNLFLHGVQKCLKPTVCEKTQSVTMKEKMTEYLSVSK